jgi:signal transduction histidine kinase
MGGGVRIESRPGQGTRVIAELPVRDAEEGV